MNNSVWRLKILSGPHQGTEIQLPSGQTTLGSDDLEADLVLEGGSLAPAHMVLELNGQGLVQVSLLADGAELVINGARHEQRTAAIADSTLIATGGVDLALAPGDSPWPELTQPAAPSVSVADREEPVADREESHGDEQNPSVTLAKTALTASAKKRRLLLAALTVSLLLVAVLFWFGSGLAGGRPKALSPLEQSQNLLDAMDFPAVTLSWDDGQQRVELGCYINSKQDKLALTRQLSAQGIRYKNRIKVMDNIIRSVDFALDELGYGDIDVQAAAPGTVLLTGTVSNRSRWAELERMLNNDIPGLKSWKVAFSNMEDMGKTFASMLAASGLQDRLQLQKSPGAIKALGLLQPQEVQRFYQVAESFRQRYGFTPELSASPRVMASTGLPIRGVSLGEVPFLVMTDNQKYTVGAKLPNGYRVQAISQEGITLSRGADTVFFLLDTYANEFRSNANDRS